MEKRKFNYFKLRFKTSFYSIVIFFVLAISIKLSSEFYFETFELRDILPLFFLEIVFFVAFLFEFGKKVIITNEGIRITRIWAKETFFSWSEVKSTGTFKYDNWGKVQPSEEKESLRNSMFISKAPFEGLSHTFLNKPGQTLKLPFNKELYSSVKQKIN